MKEKIQHSVRKVIAIVMAGAFVGLTGCATTGQFEELKTRVDAVEATASAAKADAASAKADAAAAIAKANEANARSIDTAEKIDRMFKKAMHK